MERTYYQITNFDKSQYDTSDIEEVRDALRRGNDVLEVIEFVTKNNGVVTRLTIAELVDIKDFVF